MHSPRSRSTSLASCTALWRSSPKDLSFQNCRNPAARKVSRKFCPGSYGHMFRIHILSETSATQQEQLQAQMESRSFPALLPVSLASIHLSLMTFDASAKIGK